MDNLTYQCGERVIYRPNKNRIIPPKDGGYLVTIIGITCAGNKIVGYVVRGSGLQIMDACMHELFRTQKLK